MKMAFDFSLCAAAVLLSLVVLHNVYGLRKGTVAAAFLVGGFVSLYGRWLKKIGR